MKHTKKKNYLNILWMAPTPDGKILGGGNLDILYKSLKVKEGKHITFKNPRICLYCKSKFSDADLNLSNRPYKLCKECRKKYKKVL
jgi:hypothetical protein